MVAKAAIQFLSDNTQTSSMAEIFSIRCAERRSQLADGVALVGLGGVGYALKPSCYSIAKEHAYVL
ncbi:MAG: hypothetical protein Q9217_005216 [Psora testacea]